MRADQLAQADAPTTVELTPALTELASEGVVEVLAAALPRMSYRLPADEPTSVVLHRLDRGRPRTAWSCGRSSPRTCSTCVVRRTAATAARLTAAA